MKTIYLIPLILILALSSAFSQTRTVSGTVVDKLTSKPISTVSVLLTDHTVGTYTDVNGKFTITFPVEFDTLVFSLIGYESKLVVLKPEKDTIIVELENTEVTLIPVEHMEEVSETTSYGIFSKKSYKTSSDRMAAGYSSSPSYSMDYDVGSYGSSISAGQLTAGEVNDFQKWNLWGDITENELKSYTKVWNIFPRQRYLLQVVNKNKMPVVDAEVIFSDKLGNSQWKARTDNTGKAELWNSMFVEGGSAQDMNIKVKVEGKTYSCKKVTEFKDGVNILEIPVECSEQKNVDIAFVIDATGSMSDELEYLKVELTDVISRVKDSLPSANIRLASVFYRDMGDAYVTKYSDFTENIDEAVNFIKQQYAGGGGDFPEAVDSALMVSVNKLSWSSEAASRLVFMVLDAPPHAEKQQVVKNLLKVIPKMAEEGIRTIPVACSGIDKSTEYLLRSLALATNGTYLFLTDDSGIGGTHLKPTTDKYDVELLNAALIRIITTFSKLQECVPLNTVQTDSMAVDTGIVNIPVPDSLMADHNDSLPADSNVIRFEQPTLSWKFYPNPTTGPVTIQVMNLPENSDGELYFTDITGKVLLRFDLKESRTIQTDISNFPTGTYLFRLLYDTDKWLVGKVVLLH